MRTNKANNEKSASGEFVEDSPKFDLADRMETGRESGGAVEQEPESRQLPDQAVAHEEEGEDGDQDGSWST